MQSWHPRIQGPVKLTCFHTIAARMDATFVHADTTTTCVARRVKSNERAVASAHRPQNADASIRMFFFVLIRLLLGPSCVYAPKDAGFPDVKADVPTRIGDDVT